MDHEGNPTLGCANHRSRHQVPVMQTLTHAGVADPRGVAEVDTAAAGCDETRPEEPVVIASCNGFIVLSAAELKDYLSGQALVCLVALVIAVAGAIAVSTGILP